MRPLLLIFFAFLPSLISAQHALVGTWEMVSIKGFNADGEPFYFDTTRVREIKIITPTHYMLIAYDVADDSLIFNRTYAGKVAFDGTQYIETPLQSSEPIFDNVRADYTWRVDGDQFVQSGTVVRPDGKKVILEALIFKRVKTANSFTDNPAIGTWNQLSSTYTDFLGNTAMHTKDDATRLHIITPTHWMRISHRKKKFEHVMAGTYTMKDGIAFPVIEYGTANIPADQKIEMSERVEGDRLLVKGRIVRRDGKQFTWEDVFEKVK